MTLGIEVNNQLLDIYYQRGLDKTLPHLTIIKSTNGNENLCLDWTCELLTKVCVSSVESLKNNIDLLFIQADEEKKSYTVDDITPLFKFINNNASKLPLKFIIINDAHKITPIVANKLLKVLEEPPIELAVFLLNPQNKQLLSTLQSRAIEIRLRGRQDRYEDNYIQSVMARCLTFQDFDQEVSDQNIFDIIKKSINILVKKVENIENCQSVLKLLKTIENDMIFNNSKQAQKLKLYHILREFFPHGH